MFRNITIVGLGALGVIISFAYFIPSTLELGFVGAWASAFVESSAFSVGLHWDLIFSDLIVIAMAIFDRERLGKRYMFGTVAMGLSLGVCAALAVYALGCHRTPEGTPA